MSPWTVTQRVSVNASRLAVPPKRVPVPESKMPPKGMFGSSSTVWSLMCTMPVGMRRASSIAAYQNLKTVYA